MKEYLDVDFGGSGYYAVHLREDEDGFIDVWNTGIGRYKKRQQAVNEAISWSKADEIPLREGLK